MSGPFQALLKASWEASEAQPTLGIVRGCWSTAVGAELAQHTRPVALTSSELHIDVRRGWHAELTRRAEQIRQQAQAQLPFELPPMTFHPSDAFAPVVHPTRVTGTAEDERAEQLPDETREIALRILWHIRQRSE